MRFSSLCLYFQFVYMSRMVSKRVRDLFPYLKVPLDLRYLEVPANEIFVLQKKGKCFSVIRNCIQNNNDWNFPVNL